MELLIPKVAIWRYGVRPWGIKCLALYLYSTTSTCPRAHVWVSSLRILIDPRTDTREHWLTDWGQIWRFVGGHLVNRARSVDRWPKQLLPLETFFNICSCQSFHIQTFVHNVRFWLHYAPACVKDLIAVVESFTFLWILDGGQSTWFQFHIKQDFRRNTSSGNV